MSIRDPVARGTTKINRQGWRSGIGEAQRLRQSPRSRTRFCAFNSLRRVVPGATYVPCAVRLVGTAVSTPWSCGSD